MAGEWQTVRIDEIAKKIVIGPFGSRMKSDLYTESGVPVIRGTNLTGGKSFSSDWVYVSAETADELSNCNVIEGDLVFPHRGAIGEVGIVPGDRDRYLLSTSLMMLRCDPSQAYSPYLYYFFKSRTGRHELLKNASQVGTPGIGQPLTSLKSIELFLPTVEEQRAIAHILGTLDDKIELNRRMNETLEAIARAMFKSWFLDFDPVRAKMSGEPPESICQRLGLTPDLLAVFPDRLVDSELGEIPEGWEVHGLDRMATLITKSVSPSSKPDEVFEHYSIPAFDAGGTPSYELGASIKSNKYVVSPTSVLVSKLNPETRRIWLPSVKTANAVCSTEFMQFEPRFDCVRTFLYLLMKSETMQAEILRRVTGSTGSRQRAQPSQIAVLPIILPTEEVVRAFDSIINPMLRHAMSNVEQTQTLANLRDSLLPKLLSGELRCVSQ